MPPGLCQLMRCGPLQWHAMFGCPSSATTTLLPFGDSSTNTLSLVTASPLFPLSSISSLGRKIETGSMVRLWYVLRNGSFQSETNDALAMVLGQASVGFSSCRNLLRTGLDHHLVHGWYLHKSWEGRVCLAEISLVYGEASLRWLC